MGIQYNLHIWSSLNISRRVFLHLKYNQLAFWKFLMVWNSASDFLPVNFSSKFFLFRLVVGGGSWKPYWFYWVLFFPLFDNPYYLKYLVPPCKISSHLYSPIVMGKGTMGDFVCIIIFVIASLCCSNDFSFTRKGIVLHIHVCTIFLPDVLFSKSPIISQKSNIHSLGWKGIPQIATYYAFLLCIRLSLFKDDYWGHFQNNSCLKTKAPHIN